MEESNAPIKTQMVSQEVLKRDIDLVTKLEDYCSKGEFTQIMQEFGQNHASKFTDSEDQPLECYALYQEYCKLLDSKLDEFLKMEGTRADVMYQSCQRVQQMDQSCLMCLDWLLASTEYNEFVSMMLDFKVRTCPLSSKVKSDPMVQDAAGWMEDSEEEKDL